MYEPGTKVYYPTLKKFGVIGTCINYGDRDDVRLQGYRYYVSISRQTYSVPHSKISPIKSEGNQGDEKVTLTAAASKSAG